MVSNWRRKECFKVEEEKRFTLRMSQRIFDKVAERAKKNKRSIAKEIEYIIEQYLVEKKEKGDEKGI